MALSVKQISELAGISRRTLRFYDQKGLLKPQRNPQNGYRYYEEPELYRLQQILFFRELGFPLEEIRAILEQPGFNLVQSLQAHRQNLQDRADRLQGLIQTVDRTIQHLVGEMNMEKKDLFDGWSEEKEKQYTEEARQRYGSKIVDKSTARWNRLTPEEKEQLKSAGSSLMAGFADLVGTPPDGPAAQQQVKAWHRHINNFYPCSLEILEGLGNLYVEDPRFMATFSRLHSGLPEFVRDAIHHYCRENPVDQKP